MHRRMFEAGLSRKMRSIRTALRIRVSISAIGSVIMAKGPSSTAAGNAPGPGGSPGRAGGSAGRRSTRELSGQWSVIGRPATQEGLPACLLHPRDQAPAGQVPEADPADAELAVEAAGTPAQPAAIAMADRELARRFRLDLLGLGRHAGFTHSPREKT